MEHTRFGYWLAEAGSVQATAPLRERREADLLILGGGFTGLWTAWYAKQLEPEARIVLLESELCAHGPSGRNGGFCHAMWMQLPSMRERWGDERALAVALAAEAALARVGIFCEDEGVDAWFRPAGYMQVSTTPAHDGACERAVESVRALGHPEAVLPLSAAQVASRCASPAFRGGGVCPVSATVQPARLGLGIRERLLAAGVEIHENSAVRFFREASDGVVAETAGGGMVVAPRAVVAIGAAAKNGPLRGRITVASSHVVLTEPVPELLEEIGWTGGESITDSRALVNYFRTTNDGRIAFGWGGGRIRMGARTRGRAEVDAEVVAATERHLREYFPGLEGKRVTHAWGGPIDASPTHLPMVLPLKGGRAFAAAGYTGNGVGPSNMVGRSLASLAMEHDDDHAQLAFVGAKTHRVPPEPFQWVGGESIRVALLAKEEAELANRPPGRVASAISKIPELIGFHIGR